MQKFRKKPEPAPEAQSLGNHIRPVSLHLVSGESPQISVSSIGDRGPGNAYHDYEIGHGEGRTKIHFQEGPVQEVGLNGVTNEALLAIVIDRLVSFQQSEFQCDENAQALEGCWQALNSLKARTADRLARGVEGTYEA